MSRTYSELARLQTFEERYRYLRLGGNVAAETFGVERYLNQRFYVSRDWKDVRDWVLIRDSGGSDAACDLGFPGREISHRPYIHHLNPLTPDQVRDNDPMLLDPENLVSTTHQTHNAIHYGTEEQLPRPFVERRPGDTDLW